MLAWGVRRDGALVLKSLDLVIAHHLRLRPPSAGRLGVPRRARVAGPRWNGGTDGGACKTARGIHTMKLFEPRPANAGWDEGLQPNGGRVRLRQRLSHAPTRSVAPWRSSPGELSTRVKITILQIKCERITDPAMLAVRSGNDVDAYGRRPRQCRALTGVQGILVSLAAEAKAINEKLWLTEEELRACGSGRGDLQRRFIRTGRGRFIAANDRRASRSVPLTNSWLLAF